MRLLLRYLAAYLALVCLLGWGLYSVSDIQRFQRLTESGQRAQATVDRTDCARHQRYDYSFSVAGRRYRGYSAGATGKPCADLRQGDPLQITYLPEDPAINGSGDPAQQLSSATTAVAIAALILPAVFLLSLFSALRRIGRRMP